MPNLHFDIAITQRSKGQSALCAWGAPFSGRAPLRSRFMAARSGFCRPHQGGQNQIPDILLVQQHLKHPVDSHAPA